MVSYLRGSSACPSLEHKKSILHLDGRHDDWIESACCSVVIVDWFRKGSLEAEESFVALVAQFRVSIVVANITTSIETTRENNYRWKFVDYSKWRLSFVAE